MTAADTTLLVLGIALFTVLLVGLILLLVKNRPFVKLLPFFILPIAMIGFSEIKTWKGPWGEIDKDVASNYANNPDDPAAIAKYRTELARLEDQRAAHPGQSLPPQTQAKLAATVNALSHRANLTAESKIALSHTQLLLGETNAAAATLHSALRANTNLVRTVDPRMKFLLRPIPN